MNKPTPWSVFGRVQVSESKVGTPGPHMEKPLTTQVEESVSVIAEAVGTDGRFDLTIITPGVGSSGTYPAETLEAAGRDRVFPAGTHIYMDHPTQSEAYERPERSVRDLAGALTTDATWDGERLHAEARIYSMYAPLVREAAEDIGMSIRAVAEMDEASGERIITRITEGLSVDLVTRAGRGGRVAALLESTRNGIREATANDRREQLTGVTPDETYIVDFDDVAGWVVYRSYDGDRESTYQQSYTISDDDLSVTLTGAPAQVRQLTTYVPVNAEPTGQPISGTNTQPSTTQEESTMAEIDDAELAALRDAASAADSLRSELAAIKAESAARAHISNRLKESELPARAVERVTAESLRNLPMTDDGELDTVALDEAVTTAEKAESDYLSSLAPAGVTGFGQSAPAQESRRTHNAFGRKIEEN